MCAVLVPPGVNQMCAVLLPPGVKQIAGKYIYITKFTNVAIIHGMDTPALLCYSRHDNALPQPSIHPVIEAKLAEEGSWCIRVPGYTADLCWKFYGTSSLFAEAAQSVSSVMSVGDGHVSLRQFLKDKNTVAD
jgi:hypothetical protein